MDRGLLLAIYSVLSGWALVIASLLLIKLLMWILEDHSFLSAALEVVLGFSILIVFLYAWYEVLRMFFLRIKGAMVGPGGLEPPTSRLSSGTPVAGAAI